MRPRKLLQRLAAARGNTVCAVKKVIDIRGKFPLTNAAILL